MAAASLDSNRAEPAVDSGELAASIEHGLLALDEAHQGFLTDKRRNAGFAAGADHRLEKLGLPHERLVERCFGLVEIACDPQVCHVERHVWHSLGGKSCHHCLSVPGAPPGARFGPSTWRGSCQDQCAMICDNCANIARPPMTIRIRNIAKTAMIPSRIYVP